MESIVTHLQDVETFHRKFEIGYDGPPRVPDRDLVMFRLWFLAEELRELGEAFGVRVETTFEPLYRATTPEPDPVSQVAKAFDALLDLEYVLLGTVSLFGLSPCWDAGFRLVHEANMTKVRGKKPGRSFTDVRWDVTKPPGWTAPDLVPLIRAGMP
jgi:predicted HAD superfamily Cof-like phosphohydrolase